MCRQFADRDEVVMQILLVATLDIRAQVYAMSRHLQGHIGWDPLYRKKIFQAGRCLGER